jgi:hypothetical protein
MTVDEDAEAANIAMIEAPLFGDIEERAPSDPDKITDALIADIADEIAQSVPMYANETPHHYAARLLARAAA